MSVSLIKVAAVVVLALVGCDEAKDDVYARWKPIDILGKGKTFYSAHAGVPGTAMNRSYMPIFAGFGARQGLNDIAWFNCYTREKDKYENEIYMVKGKPCKRPLPYSVWEMWGPEYYDNCRAAREKFKQFAEKRPDAPFVLDGFLDGWFPWFMKDAYPCDVQSWVDFRKTYTNFLAISTLNESDGGFESFDSSKITNKEMRATIEAAFPPAKSYRDRVKWLERAMARQKAMYFGNDRFFSLYSSNCKWGHALAKYGVTMLGYECESQVLSGPWRFSMAHVRGAARQYHIPWKWYAAHLIRSNSRDGKVYLEDEWHTSNKWRPKESWPKSSLTKDWHEDCGTARSIIKRAMVYGYFSGANAIALENAHQFLIDDLGETPKLTKYGQDFEDVMQMAEQTPRGICYTPVAVLSPLYESFSRCGTAKFGTDAFFFTLVPVLSEDGYKHRDVKKGDQGIMFNSEFGEICDVLTPDAAQPAREFAAALAPYKWAFMMGDYERDDFDRGAVTDWVNKGGTLVTSVEYVRNGLVSENQAGLSFTTNLVRSGTELVETATGCVLSSDLHQKFSKTDNKKLYEALLDYELHVAMPRTAKPLYTDEKGNVVAWENAVGKGRVITLAARQGLPRQLAERKKYASELPCNEFWCIHYEIVAGRVTFPILRELLRKVQRETLPVSVEGDIQWGVNRIESKSRVEVEERNGSVRSSTSTSNFDSHSHWLVWLLNNKGVKKFAFEEEDIDHAFDAKVKITDKKTGKTVEKIVPAGGYTWVEM